MGATCGVGMMVYILPMLLGRTYDMQNEKVGIDIYDEADIKEATNNPIPNPQVNSYYMTIERSSEKRDFVGISGELALKVSAGLVSVRGAGEYLKDTSRLDKSVEVLIKTTFTSLLVEISPDAKPLQFWQTMKKEAVGTHVITSLTYGGEVYASVNFVAHKSEDLESIKGEVIASISKSGAFDIEAQGKLESLAQNISGKAKMEIDYYATVSLHSVPTTLEGLKTLVNNFKEHVQEINNGNGVAICAGLRPLSDFQEDFTFIKNKDLLNSLDDFNYKFNNLREAKSILKSLISSLLDNISEDYMYQIIDFSDRLTKTLMQFHEVIGNMDLEQPATQLDPALDAFYENSKFPSDSRYTIEINKLANLTAPRGDVYSYMVKPFISHFKFTFNCLNVKETHDPYMPRGTYVRWGKRSCGIKASNILYIGYLASFYHEGVGAGTQFQCLPENPDFHTDSDAKGISDQGSKLAGVRYKYLSIFAQEGKNVEDKVASCTVCETPLRPTIKTFPTASACPSNWVQEYSGYMVSGKASYWSRTEYICLDYDPDYYESGSPVDSMDPIIVPVKMRDVGTKENTSSGSSIPCVVCSK